MYQRLSDFLDQTILCETIPELEALCAKALGHYEIQHFLCTNMYGLKCSVNRRPMFGSWDSVWAKQLIKNSYFVDDPTGQFTLGLEGDGLPYYWSELQIKKELTPSQHKLFKLAWDAGLREGIVFSLRTGADELAVFSMAGLNFKPDKKIKGILQSIAFQAHARARQILLENNPIGHMPDRISQSLTRDISSLTQAEKRVIQLLAEDLSAIAIAELKDVSVSTVRKHIAAAKRKLQVDELGGLVAVAHRHKLIN